MYRLETTTGLRMTATTVEAVVSALTRQFDRHAHDRGFGWTVFTPHGTVVSHDIAAMDGVPGGADTAVEGVEHAYGLLVRDHLTHGTPLVHTGLLRTS